MLPSTAGITTKTARTVVRSAPETPGASVWTFARPAWASLEKATVMPQTVPKRLRRHHPVDRAEEGGRGIHRPRKREAWCVFPHSNHFPSDRHNRTCRSVADSATKAWLSFYGSVCPWGTGPRTAVVLSKDLSIHSCQACSICIGQHIQGVDIIF